MIDILVVWPEGVAAWWQSVEPSLGNGGLVGLSPRSGTKRCGGEMLLLGAAVAGPCASVQWEDVASLFHFGVHLSLAQRCN
jgi:hypothetical protein